ncbi:MAG: aldo/keto reductase [Kofleriaceae bacterium]|nr:aldo/keto reductase [Kofleriaceae bacterium]MBP6838563.1 aldo/keto reductase [Kofleriaceae bacterium]MBP9206488.1 aldo/keto reductase [Kofleriaceae bacterium]
MPLDHYVTLGRSGLRVSPLCLGTMTFGEDWGWGASVAESQAMLDHFLARGGNFIDTANVYTKGHSEQILGDHLGRVPHKRDRVVLASKFVASLYTGDPNGGGAGRKAIVAQCEQSLRRLQTDYLDLYWMHAHDPHTPIEETLRALDDLVASGKVRYLGLSDTPAWKCAEAATITRFRGWAPVVALQIEYSLLERTVEGELMPMARELGLGVTPWAPLKAGVLSGKYRRADHGQHVAARGAWALRALGDRTYDLLDAMAEVAAAHASTVARVALAWVMARPGVAAPIIGARTVAQLDDNLAATDLALGADETARLDKLSRPVLPFPVDFLAASGSFIHGGATINGRTAAPWPMAPTGDADRY